MPRKKDTISELVKKAPAKSKPAVKRAAKKTEVKKDVKVKKSVSKLDLKAEAISIKKQVAKIIKESEQTKATKDEASVTLPKNAPIRLLEKKILLQNLFSESVIKSAYKIAYVSSICLILVGATLATSQFLPHEFDKQLSEVIGSTDAGTVNTLDPTLSSTPALIGKVEFDFVTSIPDYVTEDLPVKFVATNASNVLAKVLMVGKTGFFEVQTESLSNSAYKATIPASKLAIGYYELRIYVKPANGDPATSFSSSKFFAGNKDQEDFYKSMQDSSNDSTESDDTTNDEDSNSTNTDSSNDTDSVDETAADTEEEEEEPVQEVEKEAIPSPENLEFEIVSPLSTISNTAIFTTKNTQQFNFLELYLRPSQSLTPRFVTLASKRLDNWQFVFDTKNIPNGEYEFFAKTKKDDKTYVSKSMKIKIYNQTSLSTNQVKPIGDNRTEPIDTQIKKEPVEEREFSSINNEEDYSSSEDIIRVDNSKTEAEKILLNNSDEISDLLRRYAIAVQAGDPALVKSVEESINKRRTELALKTLNNDSTHYLSDDIEEEMTQKIEKLQEKVVAFEALRKEKSGGSTAIDSDSDGISDLDEEKLYKTDAKEPDTDGDGVSDGIEIMRGFDPLDEKIESMISFESPKEAVGLVRSDVLEVKEVLPVIKAEQNSAELVSAEIRGKALPNSIVNIYIFSTPIVVTVRTDADGSFVYTFDKELEDGKHDVYVAMTDNTGDIVAQSNAFSFVKQAQAFTPVDAAESQVVAVETPVDSVKNTYNTVIGVGILALGLILLMLGISLRKKPSEVIEENISV